VQKGVQEEGRERTNTGARLACLGGEGAGGRDYTSKKTKKGRGGRGRKKKGGKTGNVKVTR